MSLDATGPNFPTRLRVLSLATRLRTTRVLPAHLDIPAHHPVPPPALSTCMRYRLPITLHIFMTVVWGAMVLLLLLHQMTLTLHLRHPTGYLLISPSNPHFLLGSSNES